MCLYLYEKYEDHIVMNCNGGPKHQCLTNKHDGKQPQCKFNKTKKLNKDNVYLITTDLKFTNDNQRIEGDKLFIRTQ